MSDAKHSNKLRRLTLPRAEAVIAGMVVVLFAGLALLVVQFVALHEELATANHARDALAAQVERLGASPVAGPPGSRGEPGRSVTGPRGPAGPPGPSGSAGRAGTDGKNGTDGASVTGAPGAAGATGPAGASGANGADGRPGPSGPPGPAGPAGPAGQDGKDGKDGADGKDGQNCPAGYSLQPPPDDPDALVCRRDDTPQPSDSDSPSTPQALGLDPLRRQYA
ncbi:collagen-like protein [Streptomyces sp. NPDC051452]|uniref:collagen-like protein n=1 Tax=Streptomyces sp. NPDC051452 TaxID=3365654 RepID=UPI00378F1EDC